MRRLSLAPLALAAVLCVSTALPAAAGDEATLDVVVLKDGSRIEGEIVGQDDDLVSVRSNGVLRAYPRSKVASITQVARPVPAADPVPKKGAGGDAMGDGMDRDEMDAEKPAEVKRKKKLAARTADPASLTPAAAEWLNRLISSLADTTGAADPAVTRSVVAAIRALGPAAAPQLRAAAGTATGQAGKTLTRLADDAERAGKKRAQQRSDMARRQDRRVLEELKRELDLDKVQTKAVSAALQNHRKRQKDVLRRAREDGLTREEAGALFQESKVALYDELSGTLDEAQLAALGDVYQQMQERMRKRMDRAGGKKKKGKDTPPNVD